MIHITNGKEGVECFVDILRTSFIRCSAERLAVVPRTKLERMRVNKDVELT